MDIDIPGLYANIKDTVFVENLHAALERKTNLSLILGLIDDVDEIRSMYGAVSCDGASNTIERSLRARFGDYSLRAGDFFLVLLTGDEATNAKEITESIRASVENQEGFVVPSLDAVPIEILSLVERIHITMHFGVTRASSHWTTLSGFQELVKAAEDAITKGQRKLVANRVFV